MRGEVLSTGTKSWGSQLRIEAEKALFRLRQTSKRLGSVPSQLCTLKPVNGDLAWPTVIKYSLKSMLLAKVLPGCFGLGA